MRLGYIISDERGQTDRVLAEVAERLTRGGMRLTGVVQTNVLRPQRFHCDMDLKLLPDGPIIRITQDLGDQARGCRLDTGALEQAVAAITARLGRGEAEMMILNKFGKHEAEGRGFRQPIADALDRGLPVLLGVNRLNHDAFAAFAGGLAERLDCAVAPLLAWAEGACLAAA